jgi:hypothetical protein
MRRVQRVAYRTARLADNRSGVDVAAHPRLWEEADAYHSQPSCRVSMLSDRVGDSRKPDGVLAPFGQRQSGLRTED